VFKNSEVQLQQNGNLGKVKEVTAVTA